VVLSLSFKRPSLVFYFLAVAAMFSVWSIQQKAFFVLSALLGIFALLA